MSTSYQPVTQTVLNASSSCGVLHEGVAEFVRALVRDGMLEPDDRVPSLRALARRLDVSMTTVTRAYATLEEEGWIHARPQSGFFVRIPRGTALDKPSGSRPQASAARHDLVALMRDLLAADCGPSDAVTLSLALPGPELLPVKALQRATLRATRSAPEIAAQYTSSLGLAALRREIAYRGVDAGFRIHPDDVLVTNGCAEALAIALRASVAPGAVIAVESPTFFNILTLVESLGMQVHELPTDAREGMDLDALEQELTAQRIDAVLVVANFNNPLGSCMPDAAKKRLASLAAQYGIPVIEDEVYSELYFGAHRPVAVRAFDDSGHVLTAGSFSKTIAPGYRIGWLLAGQYAERARTIKHATSMATATVPQMAIAEFLGNGTYDRHLKRIRRAHRRNVACMRYAIERHFPDGTRVSNPEGGFVLWVELPTGLDSVDVYHRALVAGVRIAPGSLFSTTSTHAGCLRLSSGNSWDAESEHAIAKLGTIVSAEVVNRP